MLSIIIAAALGASSAASPADPIVVAEEGRLQCYRPDVQKKTCQSIASYRRTGPQTYNNTALIPLSSNATLETETAVVIKSDAVCGFVNRRDVLAGTLRINGAIVEPEKAKPILERVAQAMAALADKEICTQYQASGTEFTAKISIQGSYQPDQDQAVKWIKPHEGYVVTP